MEVDRVVRAKRKDCVFRLSDIYAIEPWWIRWEATTGKCVPMALRENKVKGGPRKICKIKTK